MFLANLPAKIRNFSLFTFLFHFFFVILQHKYVKPLL